MYSQHSLGQAVILVALGHESMLPNNPRASRQSHLYTVTQHFTEKEKVRIMYDRITPAVLGELKNLKYNYYLQNT